MNKGELIPHLFRTEYRKIIAVLCRRFGANYINDAEDIASETFLTAVQAWGVEGTPENPTAWLYHVAKNKAANHLRRQAIFDKKVVVDIESNIPKQLEEDINLSPQNIRDSELQMMFAICHPIIPPEAQTGLCLRLLCGFGIDEIAEAYLATRETIYKRLARAKEKLKDEKISFEWPRPTEMEERLSSVLKTLYLLFNEGYHSTTNTSTIRVELCYEAMRLCNMLIEYPATNKPSANALMALMCFHASRLEARTGVDQELILYDEQDSSLWNAGLVSKGISYLQNAATGTTLTSYHLEAGIAYWHTQKEDTKDKWENILHYYNQLLQISYSPVAALNRTYALSKVKGKQVAITSAENLDLAGYPYYSLLLAELYTGIDDKRAIEHYHDAIRLVKSEAEKQTIQRKLNAML